MAAKRLPRPLPQAEYLRECFSYDETTGLLSWLPRPREHFASSHSYNMSRALGPGRTAGTKTGHGYIQIQLDGVLYYAHRIVWAIYYGQGPVKHIDHINGRRDDNRILNLRDVTEPVNGRNKVLRSDSASRITGVYWNAQRGKWQAQVSANGAAYYLGLYDDLNDAVEARKRANKKLDFSPLHGQEDPNILKDSGAGKLRCNNSSGYPGVHLDRGRWKAIIMVRGKQLHIGLYATKEEAIAARKAAEIHHGVADRTKYGSGAPILPTSPNQ